MKSAHQFLAIVAVTLGTALTVQPVAAQGLVWSLPEDGSWVRFEGTYKQSESRPGASADDQLEWTRHVRIQSVGTEMAEYRGEVVPCRWIEIRVITGKEREGMIVPGPGGLRIVKVLVPEARVIGKMSPLDENNPDAGYRVVDGENIPVTYIPVIKGVRKIGNRTPEPFKAKVLQVYPLMTLIEPYREWQGLSADDEDAEVGLGPVASRRYRGQLTVENRLTRSVNEGEVWLTNEVPFGMARWRVKLTQERKARREARSEFKATSEITIEMEALEVGQDARSELPDLD